MLSGEAGLPLQGKTYLLQENALLAAHRQCRTQGPPGEVTRHFCLHSHSPHPKPIQSAPRRVSVIFKIKTHTLIQQIEQLAHAVHGGGGGAQGTDSPYPGELMRKRQEAVNKYMSGGG